MVNNLISFEGGIGSGKTTIADRFTIRLQTLGIKASVVREPGYTKIGEGIRNILLNPDSTNMANKTELFLYLAARAQLIHEVIAPKLAAGETVVIDRYIDSSTVYQGIVKDIGIHAVNDLNFWTTMGIKYIPRITFILDVEVAIGLSRSTKTIEKDLTGKDETRMEAKGLSFHEQARAAYLGLAKSDDTGRIYTLDSTNNIDALLEQAIAIYKLKKRR
jgi:dTMP kinase